MTLKQMQSILTPPDYLASTYPIEGDVWIKRARTVPSVEKIIRREIISVNHENIVYDCVIVYNGIEKTRRRESVNKRTFQRWALNAKYQTRHTN